MGKLTLRLKRPVAQEQLAYLAWDIYSGYTDLPPDLTNQERATVEAHIRRPAPKAAQCGVRICRAFCLPTFPLIC